MTNAMVNIDFELERPVSEQLAMIWMSIQELWDAIDALSGDEPPERDEP